MMFRVIMAVLWLIAIAALAGAMRLPRAIDVYVKDHYFIVSKWSVIGFFLVVAVVPLVALTIGWLRAAYR